MRNQLCAVDQKPILKGPAYASRTLKGFVCEYHRDKEEKLAREAPEGVQSNLRWKPQKIRK